MEFWIHGLRAKSIQQVKDYLDGDAHDRSKLQVFVYNEDGDSRYGRFYDLLDDPNGVDMRLHHRLPQYVRTWVVNQLGV